MRSRLILNYVTSIKSLLVTEVITLYRLPGIGSTLTATQFQEASTELAFQMAVRSSQAAPIDEQTATGQALAYVDLIAIFLKASGHGMTSILGVDELTYHNDRIVGLHARRNSGWRSREVDDLGLPRLSERMRHRDCACARCLMIHSLSVSINLKLLLAINRRI